MFLWGHFYTCRCPGGKYRYKIDLHLALVWTKGFSVFYCCYAFDLLPTKAVMFLWYLYLWPLGDYYEEIGHWFKRMTIPSYSLLVPGTVYDNSVGCCIPVLLVHFRFVLHFQSTQKIIIMRELSRIVFCNVPCRCNTVVYQQIVN